jgi:hypothetical protein
MDDLERDFVPTGAPPAKKKKEGLTFSVRVPRSSKWQSVGMGYCDANANILRFL